MSNKAILGRLQKRLPDDLGHLLHTVKRENAFSKSTRATVMNQKHKIPYKYPWEPIALGCPNGFLYAFLSKNHKP
jgi:hypothetical protein